MIVYLNGGFIPFEKAFISPDDRGFMLGDGVYEVIRWDTGKFFKMDEHIERFERSLKALRIDFPGTAAIPSVAKRLVAENGLGEKHAKFYIQVTRGAAARCHTFPPEGTVPTVYACAHEFRPRMKETETGIAAITVPDIRWSRCDIKAVTLLPNILAQQRAVEAGAGEAIFVRDGFVTEGSQSNVFAAFGGTVRTAPDSNYILPGITRDTVMDLCGTLGVPLEPRAFSEEEVRKADELFIVGTTTEVTPVVTLDGRPVGRGTPGPIARKLLTALRAVMA